ncbi:MAG TPA: hemolysin family protein [Acidimicrobiales bacterium]|nr:hemolysin family protein [Acidimicrobiales bacterium]
MSGSDWLLLTSVILLVITAAFFAMAETAITRVNRVKAITLAEEGVPQAKALLKLVEHPERFLNPVLFLVLVCHLVAGSLIGAFAERRFGALGFAIALFFEVVVIFVVAEAAPKTWAVQNAERAALVVARPVVLVSNFPPLRLLARGLIGMANVLLPGKGLKTPYISEEELLALTDVALDEDVIEHEERALIHSIIEFGDTVTREVMVPRPDMVAVEGRASVSDAIEVAIASGFSRLPVYEQGVDDIVGIVFAKDLLRAEREGLAFEPVRNFKRDAHFVPETKRVAVLLPEMQRGKFHMALVVDEYGGTAGLVTLEDLIEELVGEIVDEYDVEEEPIESLPNGDVRVNARTPIDELNDLLDADLPEGDWDSVGGLLLNLLGHLPTEGESVVVDGHELTAERVQGRRIGRVRVSKTDGLAAPDGADARE